MDGIESTGAIPAPALPAALQYAGQIALRQKTARATLEELADSSDEKKRQLAKDFESVLLTRLFDQVKESIGSTGFDDDPAQDVAAKGGFGLWEDIYQHFKDLEGQPTSGELMNKEL
jgi:hypothetical protein